MRNTAILAALAITGITMSANAQVWAPGIVIDGEFDDWSGQVPVLVSDPSGDASSGRDVIGLYVANDQNNLYIRIESANALAFDGNEFLGIDRDSLNTTGFGLFGVGPGTETLVAGASVYGQNSGGFNEGAANPPSIAWGPFSATTNLELAIALNTTVPTSSVNSTPVNSFPALGQVIALVFGDGDSVPNDIVTGTYTLATGSTATPTDTIDSFSLYDTGANAASRTRDISPSAGLGFSVSRSNFAPGGPAGASDTALAASFVTTSNAFGLGLISHRFASPVNITGHNDITIDVFGSTSVTNQNLWIGLVDTGGTYFAVGAALPNTAAWSTVSVGPTSGWFVQTSGDDGVLDLANIIEWRVGVQESTPAAGGTFNLAFDNLKAPTTTAVADWMMMQ